ncbi:MAG: iron complex transport system substrate-binding protein [Cognaticolwellia sp.]|jgi:iron complex transport system substrate-binding protein
MRIVSLLPSGTELACALGLREQLVGVSHECDYPADVKGLPKLTSSILDSALSPAEIDKAVAAASLERRPIYAVDGTLLNSLKPDLILTQGVCAVCAVTPETIAEGLELVRLQDSCTAPVLSLSAVSTGGVFRDLVAIAQATGTEPQAEALITSLESRLAALGGLPAPLQFGGSAKVLMLEWPDPPWSGGHWVPEQVAAAGGIALFGGPGDNSRRLSWEEIQEADPDVIIASACGFGLEENLTHARKLLDHPVLGKLRAVQAGNFWAADSNSYFSRPAPRIVDGAELIRRILDGAEVDPTQALRVRAKG